jgi:hypothetical protein
VPTRIIRSKMDLADLFKVLDKRKLPLTVNYANGKHRTVEQNRLQRMWCKEVAEQLGDRTAEEVRGECKLTMGVPILRSENEAFCAKYDELIRHLPYETKLAYMMMPLDFPVTRLMTTGQKTRYLDHMFHHFRQMGLELTEPPQN